MITIAGHGVWAMNGRIIIDTRDAIDLSPADARALARALTHLADHTTTTAA